MTVRRDDMPSELPSFPATHPIESEGVQSGAFFSEWFFGTAGRDAVLRDTQAWHSVPLGIAFHIDEHLNIDIEGQPVTYEEWQSVGYWWSHYTQKE